MGRQVVDARVEVEGGVAHSPRVPSVLAFAVKLLSVLFSKPGMVSNAMFCSERVQIIINWARHWRPRQEKTYLLFYSAPPLETRGHRQEKLDSLFA